MKKERTKKFDTIIFNPPYLPQDVGITDRRLYGGKKGYELIEKAFKNIREYLADDGIILLLFSSLTKKVKVEQIIHQEAMDFEEVAKVHVSFEDLFVYKIKRNQWQTLLERKKYTNISYFAKGKRGVLFKAKKIIKNKPVWFVMKVKNPDSKAENRIINEAKWMKRLNKKKICPKFVEEGKNYVIYKFISGSFIIDWIAGENKKENVKKEKKEKIKKVLIDCFMQCKTMDDIKVDKEEMHHPFKHIVIHNNKPVFLDFERCHIVKEPKNVTQFCQCLSHSALNELLQKKGVFIDKEKIRLLARQYKESYEKKAFDEIIMFIKQS